MGWAIPAWLAVFWKLVDNISNLDFLRDKGGAALKAISHFLAAHDWLYTVVGFTWLSILVLWPDIKSWFRLLGPGASEQYPQLLIEYTDGFHLSNVGDNDACNISMPIYTEETCTIEWDYPSLLRRMSSQPITLRVRDRVTGKMFPRQNALATLERGWREQIKSRGRDGHELSIDVPVDYTDLAHHAFRSLSEIKYELSTRRISVQFHVVERPSSEPPLRPA